MADGYEVNAKNKAESKVLIILLAINLSMFVLEITLGIISNSTALIADSLDMLADATVYGISLYAVGKSALIKIKVASISGVLQIILGIIIITDVLRRLITGSDPESLLMIFVGFIALIANVICFRLISKHKNGEVHMRAGFIFSKNDIIANLGIIIAGVLVYLLDSRFPDLIIGLIIALIVTRGGIYIIKNSINEKRNLADNTTP